MINFQQPNTEFDDFMTQVGNAALQMPQVPQVAGGIPMARPQLSQESRSQQLQQQSKQQQLQQQLEQQQQQPRGPSPQNMPGPAQKAPSRQAARSQKGKKTKVAEDVIEIPDENGDDSLLRPQGNTLSGHQIPPQAQQPLRLPHGLSPEQLASMTEHERLIVQDRLKNNVLQQQTQNRFQKQSQLADSAAAGPTATDNTAFALGAEARARNDQLITQRLQEIQRQLTVEVRTKCQYDVPVEERRLMFAKIGARKEMLSELNKKLPAIALYSNEKQIRQIFSLVSAF